MLGKYAELGYNAYNGYCLYNNVDFNNGIQDYSNSVYGADVASTIIAFKSIYYSTAVATHTPTATTTNISSLPLYSQTCFNNMVGQYLQLRCASPNTYCLYGKVDFSNSL